jgi:hypothetical protein
MADQELLETPPTLHLRNNPVWMYLSIGLVVLLAAGFALSRFPSGALLGNKEYRSELDGFSLRYPKGWEIQRRDQLEQYQGVFVFAAEQKKTKGIFGVRLQSVGDEKVKLDEVATALDQAMPGSFADFNKLSQDKLKINGNQALNYEYTFTSQDKKKIHERLVIVSAPGRVYHLAAWSPAKNFAKVSGDFDRMIKSFSAE